MATHQETTETLRGWFTGRLPEGLFDGPPEVTVDREEITVIGRIPEPETAEGASAAEKAAAVAGRIKEFRERTRSARMRVAREAEHEFRRKVSWWVRCGETTQPYTTLAVPVMTRLRQRDRQLPGGGRVQRCVVVQALHIRLRRAQFVAVEAGLDRGEAEGLGAVLQHRVEGAQP
jgi:hypothetical protein